jgi:hypothetical protein
VANRPGETVAGQPHGDRFGAQGPDLGYALKIARTFDDRLRLAERETSHDVVAGGVAIAMRRSSLFGRAPVVHDLTVAFTVWGFLDDAPDELVAIRRAMFEGVSHVAHYVHLRDLVDSVPESALRLTPAQAARAHQMDWRRLLHLPA